MTLLQVLLFSTVFWKTNTLLKKTRALERFYKHLKTLAKVSLWCAPVSIAFFLSKLIYLELLTLYLECGSGMPRKTSTRHGNSHEELASPSPCTRQKRIDLVQHIFSFELSRFDDKFMVDDQQMLKLTQWRRSVADLILFEIPQRIKNPNLQFTPPFLGSLVSQASVWKYVNITLCSSFQFPSFPSLATILFSSTHNHSSSFNLLYPFVPKFLLNQLIHRTLVPHGVIVFLLQFSILLHFTLNTSLLFSLNHFVHRTVIVF